MFRTLCIVFSGAIMLLLGVPCADAAPQSILDYSKRLYKEGKYDSTIQVIRKYLRKNGKSAQTEHLVPLIVEAMVREGDFTAVHRLCSMYRIRYVKSAYSARMWYIEGIAYAKEEKFPQAVSAFSASLNEGVSETLDSLIVLNTEKICKYMAPEEFSALTPQKLNEGISEVLDYFEISKLVDRGQFAKAQASAQIYQDKYRRSRYTSDLSRLLERVRQEEKSVIQIGILAPVSGDEEEIGKRVVLGAQLAISQLQPANGQTVRAVVMDTRGNMIETAQKTRELVEQHKISVIVGPVLSQTATVTAAMLMNRPAVMISPTATDEGIAEIGDNIFQMNVTIGMLGRKIARYAMENLSIKEFVVMAPRTAYGQILAESFMDEVKSQNFEIVAEEYFEEGANDYRDNFLNIRKKLLIRHLEHLAVANGTDFNGEISRRDSIIYADSTLAAGGFFMPADAEDVVMLAPQVMFHRIRTQLLGSAGWHQQKVITDGRKYVTNAVISTGFEPDQKDSVWSNFVKLYKNRYNTEPDRIAALGYDAATLVMQALSEAGSDDPARIREVLLKTSHYRGLSGMVSFENGRRANSETAVYKISVDGFVRVQ